MGDDSNRADHGPGPSISTGAAIGRLPPQRPLGLMLISVYKLAKAVTLLGGGLLVIRLGPTRLVERLVHLVTRVRLDPDDRWIHLAIAKLSGLRPRELTAIGAGLMVYGVLYAIEGIGVFLQKVWAESLVVATTSLLIPLEAYEILRKPDALRIAVLTANLLIVVYLIRTLRRKGGGGRVSRPGDVTADAAT